MAGIPISGLPVVPSVLATDIFAIVQAGITSQATLAQVQTLFGFPGGVLSMANGGTGAALVPDNGAIVYSNATTMALLAHTITANQVLLSGASGAPSWSGATYPPTTNINELLFSPATNQISGLATANNATLITSLTGVPSLSQILPSAVQTNITRLGAQSVDLNMNSHFIHNVTDPTQPQDASTKAYTDLVASGLNVLLAVYAATTANLTATYAPGVGGIGATLTNSGALAAFAIDGVSPPLNARILIKNQISTLANGIFILNPIGSGALAWVLTRATDYDQPSEITPGDLVIVNNGTVNQQTSWVETATVTTVGVDPILFSQFTTTASGIVSSGLINQLAYYAANGTTVSGLPTLSNAGLLTNGSGAPGWVASTGTGAPVRATDATISRPRVDLILDTNSFAILQFNPGVGTINNFLNMQNAPAGSNPLIGVSGAANVGLNIQGAGTSGVNIKGITDGSNAPAGYVGEYLVSRVTATGITLTSNILANVTSLSLTAGDWDIFGNVFFTTSTTFSAAYSGLSTTSATFPATSDFVVGFAPAAQNSGGLVVPMLRLSIAATTTVYLVCQAAFTTGTTQVSGAIQARRVR